MTHNTEVEEIVKEFRDGDVSIFLQTNPDGAYYRVPQETLLHIVRTTLHHQLQKAREEERGRILQIVNDVELSYAVNDGRDTSEMFGGQMAACEIRRRINNDIVNQEVNN